MATELDILIVNKNMGSVFDNTKRKECILFFSWLMVVI